VNLLERAFFLYAKDKINEASLYAAEITADGGGSICVMC
jgi:hypothetical protein